MVCKALDAETATAASLNPRADRGEPIVVRVVWEPLTIGLLPRWHTIAGLSGLFAQPLPFRLPRRSSRSRATLMAIRRSSSLVTTFACIACRRISSAASTPGSRACKWRGHHRGVRGGVRSAKIAAPHSFVHDVQRAFGVVCCADHVAGRILKGEKPADLPVQQAPAPPCPISNLPARI